MQRSKLSQMLQLLAVGRHWQTPGLSAKEGFSFVLIHLWVCLKVTLDHSSFPSWKPAWWSNILDSPPYAWSHLLQVTKIYPETDTFETPGLQHLGTNALTAGDINKPVHCLCMCSSPAQPPLVWDSSGHCSATDKQRSCLQTLSRWVYRALLLLLKMESCHFVCVLAYHPPSGALWMRWDFCHSLQWSPRVRPQRKLCWKGEINPHEGHWRQTCSPALLGALLSMCCSEGAWV